MGSSIHERFEARVKLSPDAVAVVAGGDALTYRNVNGRANQLARHLQTLGVSPGVPVGIFAARSAAMLIGMLAALKASGAYVLMDPGTPAGSLALMLEEAPISVAIAQSRELAPLLPGPLPVLPLDALPPEVHAHDDSDLALGAPPDSLSYIAYDLGSGGAPSGVRVTHEAIVRSVTADSAPELGPGDVVLLAAQASPAITSRLIWSSLLRGARLVFVPGDPSPAEIEREIRRHGATALWLPDERARAALSDRSSALDGLPMLLTDEPLPSPGPSGRAGALRVRTIAALHGPRETPAARPEPVAAGEEGAGPLALRGGDRSPPSIPRLPRERPLPVSSTQRRIWLLTQLEPDVPSYTMPFLIGLPSPLDTRALERSIEEMLRRHEALRTTFTVIDAQPFQVVHPPSPFKLPVVEVDRAANEAEVRRVAELEARRPFDLREGPLFRATLVTSSDGARSLVLTLHHIIADAIAVYYIFFHELRKIYAAYAAGDPSPLPEPAVHYADFVAWQRQLLEGEAAAPHLEYWKQRLDGMPSELPLPSDRAPPSARGAWGAEHAARMPRSTAEGLRALCRQERVTPFIALLSAFIALLHRYSEQSDIVVGTVVTDRDSPATVNLFGLLLNTVVLRVTVEGDLTFRELLRRVDRAVREAREHRACPFERLVESLRPERAAGQTPLFQIAFARQPSLAVDGWTITHHAITNGTSKFDLMLDVDDQADSILARFEYRTDRFDAATVARLAGSYESLLKGALASAESRLLELPLLPPDQLREILSWSRAEPAAPAGGCFHELFEAHAARSPDAIALITETLQITYGQLNSHVNQLARYLRRIGVGQDTLVGLFVERSVTSIMAILAILKAGGGYVPIDPSYPHERRAFMAQDAGLTIMLTQTRLVPELPVASARVVLIDEYESPISSESREDLAPLATPSSVAYVIYTSGSTGRPKGVAVEHRGLCNLAAAQQRALSITPSSRILQFASLSFDASAWEIAMALGSGAALVLGTRESLTPGPPLLNLMREEAVSVATLPPSVLAALPEGTERTLPALQTLISAGEACSPSLVARWSHGRRFWNAYGPTEATVCATWDECRDGDAKITIGRPIQGVSCHVLDANARPVPIGVAGELYIGGRGIARGYLNRRALTAERFLPSPFEREPSERLYRTGDLVRYLSDGRIEFLGRTDDQVKIRGFRIELGEIEALLQQHAHVSAAAVTSAEGPKGGRRLLAYVVSRRQESVLFPDELKRWLRRKAPEHMVPSAFIFLESLPLTPNGKVDRRALRPPARLEQAGAQAPLANPTERQLAALWRETLRVPRVGPYDNFFDLGGNSLLLVHLHTELTRVMERSVTITELFQYPTIRTLAEHLDHRSEGALAIDQVRARAKKQRDAVATRAESKRTQVKRDRNE